MRENNSNALLAEARAAKRLLPPGMTLTAAVRAYLRQRGGALTVNEVAERLGVQPDCVREMIQAGRIAATKVGKHRRPTYRISVESFKAYMQNNSVAVL